jgi:hypothetical protein
VAAASAIPSPAPADAAAQRPRRASSAALTPRGIAQGAHRGRRPRAVDEAVDEALGLRPAVDPDERVGQERQHVHGSGKRRAARRPLAEPDLLQQRLGLRARPAPISAVASIAAATSRSGSSGPGRRPRAERRVLAPRVELAEQHARERGVEEQARGGGLVVPGQLRGLSHERATRGRGLPGAQEDLAAAAADPREQHRVVGELLGVVEGAPRLVRDACRLEVRGPPRAGVARGAPDPPVRSAARRCSRRPARTPRARATDAARSRAAATDSDGPTVAAASATPGGRRPPPVPRRRAPCAARRSSGAAPW